MNQYKIIKSYKIVENIPDLSSYIKIDTSYDINYILDTRNSIKWLKEMYKDDEQFEYVKYIKSLKYLGDVLDYVFYIGLFNYNCKNTHPQYHFDSQRYYYVNCDETMIVIEHSTFYVIIDYDEFVEIAGIKGWIKIQNRYKDLLPCEIIENKVPDLSSYITLNTLKDHDQDSVKEYNDCWYKFGIEDTEGYQGGYDIDSDHILSFNVDKKQDSVIIEYPTFYVKAKYSRVKFLAEENNDCYQHYLDGIER